MARPKKNGLDYFPLDVDIDQDDKVVIIIAKYGIEGFGVLIKLLMEIYKNGYFYQWTEKEQIVFSSKVNVNINTVQELVNDCIKWGFFNETSFQEHLILTSKGIQERYLLATARRLGAEISEKYSLVEVNVDINPSSSVENDNKSTQKKRKEIKVKDNIKPSNHKYEICDKEAAELLYSLMLVNNENAKKPNIEKWSNDFRLMRERDKRTTEQITYLINWSQNDDFWKGNILSPSKLREKFDQLVIRIKQDSENKKRTGVAKVGQVTGNVEKTSRPSLDEFITKQQRSNDDEPIELDPDII